MAARTIFAKLREPWHAFAWSPDGLEIAFIDRKALWRISAEGGAPSRFADFDGYRWTDLEWSDDGRIAYGVDEGIAEMEESVRRRPLWSADIMGVAVAYLWVVGDPHRAVELAKRAVELSPGSLDSIDGDEH